MGMGVRVCWLILASSCEKTLISNLSRPVRPSHHVVAAHDTTTVGTDTDTAPETAAQEHIRVARGA